MASNSTYKLKHYASAVFMIFTLLWLTVSTSIIADIQQHLNGKSSSRASAQSMEENTNPFSGLNEEKCSTNTFSEYLHESLTLSVLAQPDLEHSSHAGSLIYIAYYGELISPPPEA
jgi:hypothetical protein